MAVAYYRAPHKRTTETDYMREKHYKGPPCAIGVTAQGRTELLDVAEAEALIQEIRAAIEEVRKEVSK